MGAKLDLSSLSGACCGAAALASVAVATDAAQRDVTAALGSSASQPAAAPRRAPAPERAEQHRQKGNEWFRLRAYEEVRAEQAAAGRHD